jgi:hypothetical protein
VYYLDWLGSSHLAFLTYCVEEINFPAKPDSGGNSGGGGKIFRGGAEV